MDSRDNVVMVVITVISEILGNKREDIETTQNDDSGKKSMALTPTSSHLFTIILLRNITYTI